MWPRQVLVGCASVGLLVVSVAPSTAMLMVGTGRDDEIVGTSQSDVIRARAGDDVVRSMGGGDDVRGGPGDDVLRLGAGGIGEFPDRADAGRGNDLVYGGRGEDQIVLRYGTDRAYGGLGSDLGSCLSPGTCLFRGGPGSDYLAAAGGLTADMRGGRGRDGLDYNTFPCPTDGSCAPDVTLRGEAGNDWFYVEPDFDDDDPPVLWGESARVRVLGGPGNDKFLSIMLDPDVSGGRGHDRINCYGCGATINCGPGDDTVSIFPPPDTRFPAGTPTLTNCETIIDKR